MLNRKVIVGIVVLILSFVGIFTFALSNNNSNKDPKNQDVNNVDDNEQDEQVNQDDDTVNPTEIAVVDNQSPVISSVKLSTIEWTKNNVTLTVIARDNVGVTGYSFNGSTWQISNTTSIPTNGNVVVRVRDAAGNIATVTKAVSNIDTKAPVVVFDKDGNNGVYSQVASAKVTVTDESSVDPASLKYVWTNSATVPNLTAFEGGNFTSGGTISTATDPRLLTAPNGIYYLWILAKDLAGNGEPVKSLAFSIDNEKPLITLNGLNPLKLEFKMATFTDPSVTVTDNSGEVITATANNNINYNVVGSYTVTYTAKDSSGNVAVPVTRTVIIEDTKAPVVTLNPSSSSVYKKFYLIDVKASDPSGVRIVKYLWSTNNTKPQESAINNTVLFNKVLTPLNGNGTYYLWFFVVDNKGNKDVVLGGTYNLDNEAPKMTLKGNVNENVEYGTPYNDLGVEVSDNIDTNVKVDTLNIVNTNVSLVYKIIYTATDDAGNISTLTRTVRVLPQLTIPNDVKVEINTSFTPTKATVKVSPYYSFQINYKSSNVDITKKGIYTVTYEVEYLSMKVTKQMHVTVQDTKAPVITLKGANPLHLEYKEVTSFPDPGVTITDNSNEVITATVTHNINFNRMGMYTVTYNAKDSSGNAAIPVKRTVIIEDTKAPVVTLNPSNGLDYKKFYLIDVKVTDANFVRTVKYLWTTTNVKPQESAINNNVWFDKVVTPLNENGTYYLWFFVADNLGHKNIVLGGTYNLDNEAPKLTLKGDATVNVEYGTTYSDLGVNVSDNFDNNVKILTINHVNTSVAGVYTVVYTATDDAGNTSTITRTVKVLPQLTIPNDVTVEINTPFTPSKATVKLSPNHSFQINPKSSNVDTTKLGTYIVTYEVEYMSMKVTKTMNVTVVDTKVPTISLKGTDPIYIEIGTVSAFADPGLNISDNSGETIVPLHTVYYSPTGLDGTWTNATNNTVNVTVLGYYNIWYEAKDSSGNASSIRRTVIVRDTTVPTISLKGTDPIYIEIGTVSPFADPGLNISDNSGETLVPLYTVYYSPTGLDGTWTNATNNTVNVTVLGYYNIWYEVKDSSGNASSIRRTVIVGDTKAPEFTVTGNPSDWTKNNVTLSVNATDMSGVSEYAFDGVWQSGNTKLFSGNTSVEIKVKDTFGNVSEPQIVVISKIDKQIPTLTINPTSQTINKGDVYDPMNGVSASDAQSGLSGSIIIDYQMAWNNAVGNHTITYTIYDNAGNSNTATRTLIVNNFDQIGPNVIFGTNGSASATKSSSTTVSVNDPSGVNAGSLKYQWLTTTATPTEGSFSSSFTNSQTINTPANVTGEYYLWILAKDNLNNTTITRSNVFKLDNSGPVVTFNPNSDTDKDNQKHITVTVSDSATVNGSTLRYKLSHSSASTQTEEWFGNSNGGENIRGTFTSGTPINLYLDGDNSTYYLWIIAKDSLGNVTITKSGQIINAPGM